MVKEMSVLLFTEDGWIISHLQYLNKIYERVRNAERICSLKFNRTFFDINSQFLRNNQLSKSERGVLKNEFVKSKKRKKSNGLSQEDLEQISYVKAALLRIQRCATAENLFELSNNCDNNEAAQRESKNFYSESFSRRLENFHGGNNTENPIITEADDERYVFPGKCLFYAYDVRKIVEKLDRGKQFDFILMDPPWWNKFIRRKKEKFAKSSYKMMYNEEFGKIPIQDLLMPDGIVAVWCTNAPSHLHSIVNEMFHSWGVAYIARWYWVKVTQSGSTICDFNSTNGKQPYESLIFGRKSFVNETRFPDKKLIVSVPSCVHSHKPPIAEIIKPYLRENPKCLEIFARYLLPEWTSWGLEVLKFQHLSLYEIAEGEKL